MLLPSYIAKLEIYVDNYYRLTCLCVFNIISFKNEVRYFFKILYFSIRLRIDYLFVNL